MITRKLLKEARAKLREQERLVKELEEKIEREREIDWDLFKDEDEKRIEDRRAAGLTIFKD